MVDIIGNDKLVKMSPTGKNQEPIPSDVYNDVFGKYNQKFKNIFLSTEN